MLPVDVEVHPNNRIIRITTPIITGGGLGGFPKIVNPPGADPIHHQYAQGRTSKMTYTGADQNRAWDNSNYMFGTFTVDNVQYQKYAAGLAQKMAQMKGEKAPEKK